MQDRANIVEIKYFFADLTCTHATNGGKKSVLLLRNAFMLLRSSSLILWLSAADL